jgi:dephospho-CoA kinase
MIHIGLTGGIGSGKSTVAHMWQDLGATLLDADQIARSLTAPNGAAIEAIRTCFGTGMITQDGALARDKMRELVFSDPAQKLRLEQILHPMIAEESERQIQAAKDQGVQVLVHDIPLLVESKKWLALVDKVLVIDCSPETQIKRVKARSALSTEQILKIIHAQASRQERLQVADWVIENEHQNLEDLKAAVQALYPLALAWSP